MAWWPHQAPPISQAPGAALAGAKEASAYGNANDHNRAFHARRRAPWSPSINRSKTPRPFLSLLTHSSRAPPEARPAWSHASDHDSSATAWPSRAAANHLNSAGACRQQQLTRQLSISTPGPRKAGRKATQQRCRAPGLWRQRTDIAGCN